MIAAIAIALVAGLAVWGLARVEARMVRRRWLEAKTEIEYQRACRRQAERDAQMLRAARRAMSNAS